MDNMDSLFIAGLKGMSAAFTLGVLVAIIALIIFIYKKFILPKINKTKDIASAISNHGTEAIKGYMEKHAHTSKADWSSENDDLLYEYVLEEIEKNDLQKGLWAKALALSEGNNDKAKSLYMQYRVQAIKEELSRLHIDPSSLSPQRIWHILANGISPEEQASFQEEREEQQKLVHHKQDQEKYGKIRGWLLFFAIILVIGDLSYLEIFKLFTSEHKEAMQELFIKTSPIFSYMNTTSYIFFSGLFFNILLTISFFAKYRSTRSIAIVFFIFNILFTIMQANLFFVLKNNISDEIFNAMYSPNEIFKEFLRPFVILILSLVWIFYFIYSKRVKKTFTKENDFPTLIFISAIIPVILFMVYGGNIRDIQDEILEKKQKAEKAEFEKNEYFNLGYKYENGESGFKQDYLKAAEYYEKACYLGNSSSCFWLGTSFSYDKKGLKKDYVKSIEFYKKACELGHLSGCFITGYDYSIGQGAKQDYLKAAEYYEKACDLGDINGCLEVAEFYIQGKRVKQDYSKAKEFYGKACILKNDFGCSNYRMLANDGY